MRLITGADFDGETYEPELDKVRLTGMLQRVYSAMSSGAWCSLSHLARTAQGSEASVSARIRDLRKEKFGGFEVQRKRIERGLFHYRLVLGQEELF